MVTTNIYKKKNMTSIPLNLWLPESPQSYIVRLLSFAFILANVFLIRNAVKRAAGFGYQHSFITVDILWSTSEFLQRFGVDGLFWSVHTIFRISSIVGSGCTVSKYGNWYSSWIPLILHLRAISHKIRPNAYTSARLNESKWFVFIDSSRTCSIRWEKSKETC